MEVNVIVTFLALLQYIYFGIEVGGMRGKSGVKAPAMAGDERFERMNRVHQNTMEQLIIFLPALWMHALYANPWWGAALGAVFIVGRLMYRAGYLQDPAKREAGFATTFFASAALLLWALGAAVMELL